MTPNSAPELVGELLGIDQRGPLVRTEVVTRKRHGRICLAADIEPVVVLHACKHTLEILKHSGIPPVAR